MRYKEPLVVRAITLLLTVACMVATAAGGRVVRAAEAVLQPIERVLPPQGVDIPADVRARLKSTAAALGERIERFRRSDAPKELRRYLTDVEVYLKGAAWALELDEFFATGDAVKAARQLETGNRRLSQLEAGQVPWRRASGQVVRGFVSSLDGSTQPYGLIIPENLDLDRPCPLYVWLHGRGDRTTEINFIDRIESSPGRLVPKNAIVLHPFGRYCNGFKSAGEVDVMEAIRAVKSEYSIDEDRLVLAGFSMGGAGAWHLGAHYPSLWAAVQPGAGFVETALYQNLTPATYPPPYERTLWSLYDVPGYVRNLFNMPVLAYSGEIDKQRQAATVMAGAFAVNGRTLDQLIGPNTEHALHPDSLAEIHRRLAKYAAEGINRHPSQVWLETRTLRYNDCHWIEMLGLGEHWRDARVDALRDDEGRIHLATENVTALRMTSPWADPKRFASSLSIDVDGQSVSAPALPRREELLFAKADREWRIVEKYPLDGSLRKIPGLTGPIDDVVMKPFLLVTPSGKSEHPMVERWVQFELNRFRDRWRRLFRGEVREKRDTEVTEEHARKYNLIVFGDPTSNRWLAQVADDLPLRWTDSQLEVAGKRYDSSEHVLLLIYPNPLAPNRYLAINSGMTFREGHDRTNSLQNPKLGDWAVISLAEPPDALQPGRVRDAGFFDERWQFPAASDR